MPKPWTRLKAYSGHSAAGEVVHLQFEKIQIEAVLREMWKMPLVELESRSSHRTDQGSAFTGGPLNKCLEKNAEIFARCAGFGWRRVHFLHSSWYGVMFCICARNSVDSSGMF